MEQYQSGMTGFKRFIKIIEENVEKEKKCAIVIAHSLSTIKNADKIIVLTDKGIDQRGTYGELLSKRKIYEKLSKLSKIS